MRNSQLQTAPAGVASVEDARKLSIRQRVQHEFEAAKASGLRFTYIPTHYDEDFADFIAAVTHVANSSNPPPHAMAPYFGESSGRHPHDTKISAGVLITF